MLVSTSCEPCIQISYPLSIGRHVRSLLISDKVLLSRDTSLNIVCGKYMVDTQGANPRLMDGCVPGHVTNRLVYM